MLGCLHQLCSLHLQAVQQALMLLHAALMLQGDLMQDGSQEDLLTFTELRAGLRAPMLSAQLYLERDVVAPQLSMHPVHADGIFTSC